MTSLRPHNTFGYYFLVNIVDSTVLRRFTVRGLELLIPNTLMVLTYPLLQGCYRPEVCPLGHMTGVVLGKPVQSELIIILFRNYL
jgi:hypothetical protein